MPCDLFMEHLNRVCKEAVFTLGGNKTPKAIERCGKCVGSINELLEEFDCEVSLDERSGRHSIASAEKDKKLIIKTLLGAQVFTFTSERTHSCFKDIKINLVPNLKHNKKIVEWMKKHVQSLLNSMP